MPALTVSGNEVTDAVRLAGLSGDGLAVPDSSFGILPSVTNLAKNGGVETGLNSNTTGGWDNWLGASGTAVTRDTTKSKFGSASIKCDCAGHPGGGVNPINSAAQYIPVTVGTTYTASGWIWAPAGVVIGMTFLITNAARGGLAGQTVTTTITGNGAFQRASVTITASDPASALCYVTFFDNGNVSPIFWVDGVQCETGPVANAYVETNGGTATRSAGNVLAPASLLTTAQGFIAGRLRMRWGATLGFGAVLPGFFAWTKDGNNSIKLLALNKTTARYQVRTAGSQDQIDLAFPVFAPGDDLTFVAYWTTVGGFLKIGLSFNGAAFTVLQTAIPAPTIPQTWTIASDAAGRELESDARWYISGTGVVTDADASAIHAWGNVDPNIYSFPPAMGVTAVMPFFDSSYIVLGAPFDVGVTDGPLRSASVADAPLGVAAIVDGAVRNCLVSDAILRVAAVSDAVLQSTLVSDAI